MIDDTQIGLRAAEIHAAVNHEYDGQPYSVHLSAVAQIVKDTLASLNISGYPEKAIIFGAWFHDSIEDARLTYNDVLKEAKAFMGNEEATVAAEIVYALTNDKGRTRADRAGSRYYQGIRDTSWAPLVKAADRLANIQYSEKTQSRMFEVYKSEMKDFIREIGVFYIPTNLQRALLKYVPPIED